MAFSRHPAQPWRAVGSEAIFQPEIGGVAVTWLFAEGRVALLVLAVMALEAGLLLAWHRRTGRGLAPRAVAAVIAPGLGLVGALYAAMVEAGPVWIGAGLGVALVAHLADLAQRWQR